MINNETEIKLYAEHFYELGLNIGCIVNYKTKINFLSNDILKVPYHEWAQYQNTRQNSEQFNSFNWDHATGYGVILGHENLAALDIDGCVSDVFLKFVCDFLDLPIDYDWIFVSGSGCGYHLLFKCSDRTDDFSIINNELSKRIKNTSYNVIENNFGRLDVNAYFPAREVLGLLGEDKFSIRHSECKNNLNNYFDKMEFKWKGFLVLPKSMHRSGRRYSFYNNVPKYQPLEVSFKKLAILRKLICEGESDASTDSIVLAGGDDSINVKRVVSRFIVLDTETNGLPTNHFNDGSKIVNWPRLLQIAWIVCDRNGYAIRREIHSIKPNGFNIDSEASSINGLDNECLDLIGEPIKPILERLYVDLKNTELLVCHNCDFDVGVIESEFKRNGLNADILKTIKQYCTMKDSQNLEINDDGKFPKLTELYEYCFNGLMPDVIHTSMVDASITKKCYVHLKKIF